MGCAVSKLSATGTKPAKATDEPQTVLRGGKVFNLQVQAGLKAADTQQRPRSTESPPISARQPSARREYQQQQQQPPAADDKQQLEGYSSTTRARRLSFTTGPGISTGPNGGPALAAPLTSCLSASNARTAAAAAASSAAASQGGGDGGGAPAALSAQPTLPEAHPLPVRRVHFDDSPIKTLGPREDEQALFPVAAAASAAAGRALGTPSAVSPPPRPLSSCLTTASSRPADGPDAAIMTPVKAAAAAFAAAEARLRRSLSSPSKAAAAAAVPMSELIHSVASLSRAGREPTARKTNQDTCFAFSQYCRPNQALLAALDGHGPHGHLVSDFLKTKMPLELAEQLGEGSSRAGSNNNSSSNDGSGSSSNVSSRAGAAPDVAAALSATFLRTNEALRSGSGVNITYSGSTAVLCMLQGRRLTTAWVGDSRAVLARQEPRGCRAIPLTRDHKPGSADERSRIILSGGRVERLQDHRGNPVGPQRVWLADSWVPGLAMSRAMGDAVAHSVGVTSEPETSTVELCPQDRWLLLATDGVWEFIDCQLAVDIVSGCQTAEEACRLLVETAWGKWLIEEGGVVDDITVVAVKLNVR
ncbi:hypothetical protein D9Q98_010606 [Chlorella vulgaris]|uniref:PPM-type phosphatase domain-containing protein n=1 Tax=Chlorella vulgaris TaxID=3077 RepID=A0A9D4YYD5_CHLVU|nr:hypothetical protein D9Q98_010606 [Chlorella vulgaris]